VERAGVKGGLEIRWGGEGRAMGGGLGDGSGWRAEREGVGQRDMWRGGQGDLGGWGGGGGGGWRGGGHGVEMGRGPGGRL